jgi:hypothetical protein
MKKTILWLEDEIGLLGDFAETLSSRLESKGCQLRLPPFTTAPELIKFLGSCGPADEPISTENTCLLIDIMLPGHSYVHRPEGWLGGPDQQECFYEAARGRRAGLVLYRNVILPRFNPPLPVVFLTSVMGSSLETERKELDDIWVRANKGQSPAKIAFMQKRPGDRNIEELLLRLSDWDFCK